MYRHHFHCYNTGTNYHTHKHTKKSEVYFMPELLSVQVETLFHFDFFSSLDFESFHTLKKKKKMCGNI